MKIISNYFPSLTDHQISKFDRLLPIYRYLNSKLNLISRKDIDNFYLHHVIHSLGIAKFQEFKPGAKVLDLGTGGGFPGIPLAIFFPQTHFYLIDSIGKKIDSVREVVGELNLDNVSTQKIRAENFNEKIDFVVVRAVAKIKVFLPWIKNNFSSNHTNFGGNGLICLKGGDVSSELACFPKAEVVNLNRYFSESFFETKKIIYLPYF